MGKFIDLTGQRFGRLVVLERDCLLPKRRQAHWVCVCDCGNYTSVASGDLRSGHTKSCGCYVSDALKKRNATHGLTDNRIYLTWRNMKLRCYNVSDKRYKDYGARGIKVCDEWLDDLRAFYDWSMANGYSEDLSIDRIDVNGNYEPSNCRWVDIKTQANNKRTNRLITAFGQTRTLSQWVEKTGISREALKQRLNRGWSVEEALTKKMPHRNGNSDRGMNKNTR